MYLQFHDEAHSNKEHFFFIPVDISDETNEDIEDSNK